MSWLWQAVRRSSRPPPAAPQLLEEQSSERRWAVLRAQSNDLEDITIFEHAQADGETPAVVAAVANCLQVPPRSRALEGVRARPLTDSAAQRLKRLRHPCIVCFQWEQATDTVLSVVTKPVVPLAAVVADMVEGELVLGLYRIAQALGFLHEKASGRTPST